MEYILLRPRLMFALGLTVLFLIALSFMPMSWFKKTTYASDAQNDALTLINKKLSSDYITAKSDVADIPNWKKALLETTNGTATDTISTEEQKRLDDPNNLTSQFAKNAYTISAYLSQQDMVDSNTINEASKNTIDAELSKLSSKTYTKSDLKTTSKNDSVTLKKYGNDLVNYIFNTLKVAIKIDDKGILASYLKNKNVKELEKYNPEIKAFTKLRDELKNMTIPETAVDYHLAELNSVEVYLDTVNNLAKIDTDPIRASAAYGNLEKTSTDIFMTLKNFKDFFSKQSVVFTPKEVGYIFN